MKATRKLIPAFAMLLIAAVMMSTATFAWFSTNASVTATGMVVHAKASSTFLVISSAKTGDITGPGYQTITAAAAAASGPEENTLIPVTFDEDTQKWYVYTAQNSGTSAKDPTTQSDITTGVKTGSYLFKRTFYFRIATNFADAKDLKLTGVTVAGSNTDFSDCLSVVAVPEGATDWTKFNAFDTVKTDNPGTDADERITNDTALYATVGQTVVGVDVYVFIDGEHADVFTANVTNLHDLEIGLEFSVGE